jgi:hypothetical protein
MDRRVFRTGLAAVLALPPPAETQRTRKTPTVPNLIAGPIRCGLWPRVLSEG